MKIINQASFYVTPTILEGFWMTSVEITFLNKAVIASDIYIHKEILGDFPINYKSNNINFFF